MTTTYDRMRKLSLRERDTLYYMAKGLSAKEIAQIRVVAVTTVRSQIKNVLSKLEVNSQIKALALFYQQQPPKFEYEEDNIFFELEPNGKLYVVHNGYPDVETNVQKLALYFPNSIFFFAYLSTEESDGSQLL